MAGPVEDAARDVHRSAAVQWLARLGLASRGVVWLVVGLLAASIARGRDQQADREGALRAIADRPLGGALLVLLVVGFTGYALWRALSAAVGHRDEEGRKRLVKRLVSAGKALLYGFLALSTLRFLLAGSGSGDQTPSLTARVLSHSGGRVVVAAVGLAVVGTGLAMAVRALRQKHREHLEQYRVPPRLRDTVVRVGTAGLVGRGLVLVLLGGFLLRAAAESDPKEAKGLDAALASLGAEPYGQVMLAVAALGMLAYAVWSFLEAAFRDV